MIFVSFRAQSRWEGGTLLQKTRGERCVAHAFGPSEGDLLVAPRIPLGQSWVCDTLCRDNCLVPHVQSCCVARGRLRKHGKPDGHIMWLPLAYHPWWRRVVRRAVARFNRDESMNALLLNANPLWRRLSIRIAWSNMLPKVQTLLQ